MDELSGLRIQLEACKLILGLLLREVLKQNPDDEYFLELLSRFDKLLLRAEIENLDVTDEQVWSAFRKTMREVMHYQADSLLITDKKL